MVCPAVSYIDLSFSQQYMCLLHVVYVFSIYKTKKGKHILSISVSPFTPTRSACTRDILQKKHTPPPHTQHITTSSKSPVLMRRVVCILISTSAHHNSGCTVGCQKPLQQDGPPWGDVVGPDIANHKEETLQNHAPQKTLQLHISSTTIHIIIIIIIVSSSYAHT